MNDKLIKQMTKEELSEYHKKLYDKHHDKRLEQQHKCYQKHKEQRREAMRQYYYEHREELNKKAKNRYRIKCGLPPLKG